MREIADWTAALTAAFIAPTAYEYAASAHMRANWPATCPLTQYCERWPSVAPETLGWHAHPDLLLFIAAPVALVSHVGLFLALKTGPHSRIGALLVSVFGQGIAWGLIAAFVLSAMFVIFGGSVPGVLDSLIVETFKLQFILLAATVFLAAGAVSGAVSALVREMPSDLA